MVPRELRPDEGVERDRDLLCGDETAAEEHRAAHVDEEHGRRSRQLLGPKDLEILRVELQGGFAALPRRVLLALERVRQGPVEVEVERVTEFVGLGRLLPLTAAAGAIQSMAAEGVAAQP